MVCSPWSTAFHWLGHPWVPDRSKMASQALPVNQVNIKPFLTGHIPTSVKLSNVTLFHLSPATPLVFFLGQQSMCPQGTLYVHQARDLFIHFSQVNFLPLLSKPFFRAWVGKNVTRYSVYIHTIPYHTLHYIALHLHLRLRLRLHLHYIHIYILHT